LGIPKFDDAGQLAGQFIDSGFALIQISQVALLNDWDTTGLRGSLSTSVAVKEVFVPYENIARLSKTPCRKITDPLVCVISRCVGWHWFPFLSTEFVFHKICSRRLHFSISFHPQVRGRNFST
jgi:hypothetical protein